MSLYESLLVVFFYCSGVHWCILLHNLHTVWYTWQPLPTDFVRFHAPFPFAGTRHSQLCSAYNWIGRNNGVGAVSPSHLPFWRVRDSRFCPFEFLDLSIVVVRVSTGLATIRSTNDGVLRRTHLFREHWLVELLKLYIRNG